MAATMVAQISNDDQDRQCHTREKRKDDEQVIDAWCFRDEESRI